MKFFLLFFLIFLIGCSSSKPLVVYETIEKDCETINETIYINNTKTIIINNTEPCNVTSELYMNTTSYDRDYILSLIRQLKYYEKQQDDYYNYNDTECSYDLNQSNIKLEEYKNELCKWNSSWC